MVALFSWGRGKNFRLGRELSGDCRAPERLPEFDGVQVVDGSCGGGHTCVVTADGRLFVFGYSQYGQLGLGDRQDVASPTQVSVEDGPFASVACGRYHTVALTASGHVYSWGGGKNGRLGLGDEKIRTLPGKVLFPFPFDFERVTAISCGYHSSMAVTSTGSLYSWGWGAHGQLGHEDTTDKFTPTLVSGLRHETVSKVCTGDRHSLALTASGRVYGWGSNEYGQLGIGTIGDVFPSPKPILGLVGLVVTAVSSGDRHSACVTNLGSVYAWGHGSDGQVGCGDWKDGVRPRVVMGGGLGNFRAKDVECGHNFTMARTEDGVVFSWGNDTYGQLGVGGATGASSGNVPTRISLEDGVVVSGLVCAHFHCILWTEDVGRRHPVLDTGKANDTKNACSTALRERSEDLASILSSIKKTGRVSSNWKNP